MGKKQKKNKKQAKSTSQQKVGSKRPPFLRIAVVFILALAVVLAVAWPDKKSSLNEDQAGHFTFEVLRKIPHDKSAFTQGFLYHDGYFYESTGRRGSSQVRKIDPNTGDVMKEHSLEPKYFGEGLAFSKGVLVQITWTSGKAFTYHSDTFQILREYDYVGQGWGLTHDDRQYIMSDGTDMLTFRDESFKIQRKLKVQYNGKPVTNLNELEYINGEIWANVWQSWDIVRINPQSGQVVGIINFAGLLTPEDRNGDEDSLNGIAYDPQRKAIYITGKHYSNIYEITVKPTGNN